MFLQVLCAQKLLHFEDSVLHFQDIVVWWKVLRKGMIKTAERDVTQREGEGFKTWGVRSTKGVILSKIPDFIVT